jgi:hypothetical protein
MIKKKQLDRISQMEDRFDEVTRVMAALDEAVSEYADFKSEIKALQDYMESGQWKEDYEADEAGKIPANVKRGVLSEDGLYDLLEESDRILARAREILA